MQISSLPRILFASLVFATLALTQAQAKVSNEQLGALMESAKSDPVAARKVGLLLIAGKLVPQDVAGGFRYLEQAARLGDTESGRLLLKSYQDPRSKFYSPTKATEIRQLIGETGEPTTLEGGSRNRAEESDPKFGPIERWPTESLPTERAKGFGSGFAINTKGVFITNFHVIDRCARVVVLYNGMRANARVIGVSEGDDLAALQVNGKTPIFLPIRRTPVGLGEGLTVAGYPWGIDDDKDGMALKLSQGIVARFINEEVLQMSASVSSGNSGGPVVDKSGSVVGVAVGKIPAGMSKDGARLGDDYNFAIRPEKLLAFVARLREEHLLKNRTKSVIDTEVIARVLQQASSKVFCYR